jgi:predicted MFS family arabinose efflux permease
MAGGRLRRPASPTKQGERTGEVSSQPMSAASRDGLGRTAGEGDGLGRTAGEGDGLGQTAARQEIRRALVAVLVARTAINGALRVVYPFLPAIARGLDVSLGALGAVIALRNLGGMAAPLGAWAAERRGRRAPMVVAVVAVATGCFITASTTWFWVAAVGIAVVGLAKPLFDVSMQAWFGDRAPAGERGRIYGMSELTWPLGIVVAVPASGLLIERYGWQVPFVLAGVLTTLGVFVVRAFIGSDKPERHVARPLALTAARLRLLAAVTLFSLSSESIFVVYGEWLETTVGLSVAGIGLFTIVVVAGEATGEGTVAAIADRVGLRRMTLIGLAVSAGAYLLLGIAGASLLSAALVVFVWVTSFELTVVAAIPLASGLAPESRDRLLSLMAVAIALGRAVGALLAPALFITGGIALNGAVAAGGAVVSAVLLSRMDDD